MIGEASDHKEALRKLKKISPDVIILDIDLPSMDGSELARIIRKAVPQAKIIAFSIHASQEHVVRMARCGAHGYVMKDKPTVSLVDAINTVYKGGLYFPATMSDAILAPSLLPAQNTDLTPREREVLALLAEGLANKQVAQKLGISVRTAETHREHLSHKLKITTLSGLTKYAIAHGMTSL